MGDVGFVAFARGAAHRLWNKFLRWRADEGKRAPDLVRRRGHEVAPELHKLAGHRRRIHEHAAEHDRAEIVKLNMKGSHDPEVPTTTPQTPEQLRVLGLR